jgi:hypothetical protein
LEAAYSLGEALGPRKSPLPRRGQDKTLHPCTGVVFQKIWIEYFQWLVMAIYDPHRETGSLGQVLTIMRH